MKIDKNRNGNIAFVNCPHHRKRLLDLAEAGCELCSEGRLRGLHHVSKGFSRNAHSMQSVCIATAVLDLVPKGKKLPKHGRQNLNGMFAEAAVEFESNLSGHPDLTRERRQVAKNPSRIFSD